MDIREFQAHMWALFHSITLGMDSSLRPIVESHGVTMTQMRILIEWISGESSRWVKSARPLVRRQATPQPCAKPWKKGLVSRNRSLEDERIVLIAITPAGSTLLKPIEGELSSKFDHAGAVFCRGLRGDNQPNGKTKEGCQQPARRF